MTLGSPRFFCISSLTMLSSERLAYTLAVMNLLCFEYCSSLMSYPLIWSWFNDMKTKLLISTAFFILAPQSCSPGHWPPYTVQISQTGIWFMFLHKEHTLIMKETNEHQQLSVCKFVYKETVCIFYLFIVKHIQFFSL